MKEIKAFIKPSRVNYVVEALKAAGFVSMTLSKGEGTGAHEQIDAKLDLEFLITDSLVVKLELVCNNEESEKVMHLIFENARSSGSGDGIIYVTNIEDAFYIKTGKSLKRYDF
ncbi:MAG: P-II family nitrogen regulator [Chitinophagales bacterium]